ncbi:MAG: APC family permease [Rhodoglobus sp.]
MTDQKTFPPVDAGMHGTTHHPLSRNLGVGAIVFMVVAAAAPLGVVVANTPIIIGVSGSFAAPLFFIGVTIILLLFSVGFTFMSRHITNAGAFYSYIQAGIGRIPGIGAATLALGAYFLLFIAVVAYAGVATSNVIAGYLAVDSPWWMWALVWLAIIGVLGYRDIELSSKVLGVLLVVETLAVVVLDVAIIGSGGADGLSAEPFNPAQLASGAPGLGVMFAFFCFFGFEATAVFRSEARNPDRTIPRATYISVIAIGAFYTVSAWAVVVGAGTGATVDSASTNPEGMVIELAATYVSPILADVMQVLLVTSFVACVISFHNVIARYLFTLGGFGVLPRALGITSAKYRAPSRASAVVSIVSVAILLATVVIGMDPVSQIYTWFSGAATLGIVVLLALTCVSVIVFFRRSRTLQRGIWQTAVAPGLALIALVAVLVMVVTNFDLLVGNWTAASIFIAVIVAMFVIGAGLAVLIRRRRPEVYSALGSDTKH